MNSAFHALWLYLLQLVEFLEICMVVIFRSAHSLASFSNCSFNNSLSLQTARMSCDFPFVVVFVTSTSGRGGKHPSD